MEIMCCCFSFFRTFYIRLTPIKTRMIGKQFSGRIRTGYIATRSGLQSSEARWVARKERCLACRADQEAQKSNHSTSGGIKTMHCRRSSLRSKQSIEVKNPYILAAMRASSGSCCWQGSNQHCLKRLTVDPRSLQLADPRPKPKPPKCLP